MDKVATTAVNTRADLFREAAARRRLPPDAPSFDEILTSLAELEAEINQ